MITSDEKSIDKCLSIEISKILMREIMKDLRLEGMVELPNIGIFLCIFHHLIEIVSDTSSLATHNFGKMIGASDRIYRTREKIHESVSKNPKVLITKSERSVFFGCKSYRLTIANSISVKSELDTIRENELRISEISRELLRFLDLFKSDMHILGFSIRDRKSILSLSFEKYKIRFSVFTSFRFIDNMKFCQLCE